MIINKFGKLKSIGFALLYTSIYFLMQIIVTAKVYSLVIVRTLVYDVQQFSATNLFDYSAFYNKLFIYTIPVMIIAAIITMIISFGLFSYKNNNMMVDLRLDKINVGFSVIAILMTIPVIGLSNFIVDIVVSISPSSYSTYFDTIVTLMETTPTYLLVIGVGIVAPITEELIFRGFVYSKLKYSFPIWAAILIQAFLFGIVHGNLIQFSYAFIIGIILGILVYKSKSIYPAIILHVINNTISIFTDLYMDNILYFILPIATILIVFIILFDKRIGNKIKI